MQEEYLGDGLYASWNGYDLTLRAPRDGGDHYVVLEPAVLRAFEEYVAEIRASFAHDQVKHNKEE
jgi:hypothetical protein